MQAHGSACIMEHSAFIFKHPGTFCMHSGIFWNILHAFCNILEHFACILEYSWTFCMHSGTLWNILQAFCNILGELLSHTRTDWHTDIRTCWAVFLPLKSGSEWPSWLIQPKIDQVVLTFRRRVARYQKWCTLSIQPKILICYTSKSCPKSNLIKDKIPS